MPQQKWLLLGIYGLVFAFLAALGSWLALDILKERERTLADAARLVAQKSQYMSRAFGDTFLATDYVLSDVMGHITPERDLRYPDPDPVHLRRMEALLEEKAATIPVLVNLLLFDSRCMFTASVAAQFRGKKGAQRFCDDMRVPPGKHMHVQYMTADESASKRPIVAMAQTLGSADGQLLGGVVAIIDLAYAQAWLSEFETDAQDVQSIVDIDGTLLVRHPPMPQAVGGHAVPPAPLKSFADLHGVITFEAESPWDGRVRIMGLCRLERFPFIVSAGFDKSAVLDSWERRAWQFAKGYVVLMLLTLLVLWAHLKTLKQREAMKRLASTDVLTGIANRRHLLDTGNSEFARARRYGKALSVLMLDIDRFKRINDSWGHAAGDRVIREVACMLVGVIRAQDIGGRLGGEEFAAILPETELAGALAMAERLRVVIQDSRDVITDSGQAIDFTASIGVAELSPQTENFEALLRRADQAMYRAKEEGRNRVLA